MGSRTRELMEAAENTQPVEAGSPVAERRPAVLRHVERQVGPADFKLQLPPATEPVEGVPEPEILVVKANAERPFHTLVTSGLSDRAMPTPQEEWKFAELCLLLPADWPLEPHLDYTTDAQWPVRWLYDMAHMPLRSGGWLGYGHSVPNGEPPRPFAPQTKLCSWLLLPPVSLPQSFTRVRLNDNSVLNFWTLVPLHQDETYLKVNKGTPALIEKLAYKGVSDILDPQRKSVFERGGGTLLRWFWRL